MAWQCFEVTYELRSPLHIGYHKVGNVQRTRYYIPARNLWGAVTERLTRGGFSASDAPEGNYGSIGEWVKQHCAFGYFFLWDGSALYRPHYTEAGLRYDDLDAYAFARRYLNAHVTTALDAATASAETGSLHEVEYIAPRDHLNGRPVKLRGWLFLDETAKKQWEELQGFLQTLRVGGERRYGWGQLRMTGETQPLTHPSDGYEFNLAGERPLVTLQTGQPLLAHTLSTAVEARGEIEPLVGRETRKSHRFGAHLTAGRICWTPGSKITAPATFTIDPAGYWIKHQ
jgi:hypothetical protein